MSDFVTFSDNGGSLLVFGDTDAASFYRRLANEFGLDFYEQGTRLYSESKNKTLLSSSVSAPSIIIPSSTAKIGFSGTGITLNVDSSLLTPLFSSETGDYVRNEFKKTEKQESAVVAVAFQGRNNARAVFVGSVDVCSNDFFSDKSKGNEKACGEMSKWAMNEKGVLRYSGITHFRTGEKHEKGHLEGEYTINDEVYYSIDIEEFRGGKWSEHKTENAYVEFIMLDPKIRKYLTFKSGSLFTRFKAPDVHGVYQFKVSLHEPGYSWVDTASKATVRPYKHNQFERFLTCAYPYYASVFASMTGFLIFSFYFLYHKDT